VLFSMDEFPPTWPRYPRRLEDITPGDYEALGRYAANYVYKILSLETVKQLKKGSKDRRAAILNGHIVKFAVDNKIQFEPAGLPVPLSDWQIYLNAFFEAMDKLLGLNHKGPTV
jgi:hypothetical protein